MFMAEVSIKGNVADVIVSVSGMTCNNCAHSVTSAIYEVSNVENVNVDLASGKTMITGNDINIDEVVESITSSGYSAEVIK
jgi:copper chaperone CopZ